MRGRKPYPYAVMDANNDKERLTKEELKNRKKYEPKIKSNFLKCPKHLCKEAGVEWKRIVRLYGEIGEDILCDLDCNALEIYCNAVVTYRKAMQKVNESSEVYMKKGDPTPRKNPWLRVANEAAEQIKKYGELLLLNPVSRARVGVARAKVKQPLTGTALFMQRRREEQEASFNAMYGDV